MTRLQRRMRILSRAMGRTIEEKVGTDCNYFTAGLVAAGGVVVMVAVVVIVVVVGYDFSHAVN